MYIDNDYLSYSYLVEAHDNYVILSNVSSIQGESGDFDSVHAVYNYFSPPVTIPFTYYSYDTFNFPSIEVDNNFSSRADFPFIFLCSFTLIFVLIFIINQLSKLVKKGRYFWF